MSTLPPTPPAPPPPDDLAVAIDRIERGELDGGHRSALAGLLAAATKAARREQVPAYVAAAVLVVLHRLAQPTGHSDVSPDGAS